MNDLSRYSLIQKFMRHGFQGALLYCILPYDIDQNAASVYKHSIVLWLGKYHDIALW